MKTYKNILILSLSLFCGLFSCYAGIDGTDIATGQYYIGNIGPHNCILKFDDITTTTISGEYYLLTNTQTIHAEKFTAKVSRRKYKLQIGNRKFNVRLAWTSVDTVYQGSYVAEGCHDSFYFVPYHSPQYKTFPERYKSEYFDVIITKDVEYGKAEGFWTSYTAADESNYFAVFKNGLSGSIKKKELSLKMDVYQPKGDTLKKRPLIIMMHGGAYYMGDKETQAHKKWCTHFASMGYVAVSINYRIGFRPSKQSIERTGYNALQDAHAAVRYLLNHEEYKIDPDLIFAGGTSAGSMTALNLAYMRNNTRPKSSYGNKVLEDLGTIESSGNKYKAKFTIKAMANMWGALNDLKQLENSKGTAIISFHGNKDKLVPYDIGYPFSDVKGPIGEIFFEKMYGSAAIHRRALELGMRSEFYPLDGMAHGPHEDKNNKLTPVFYIIQEKMTDFFYPEIVTDNAKLIQSPQNPLYYVVTGTNISETYWKVEGGLILMTQPQAAKVVWFDDAPVHKIYASGHYDNGASFKRSAVIK